MKNKNDSKQRLLDIVIKLILEDKDINDYTVRDLAELAQVNPAMINYYYQSRDNLIFTAAGICMSRLTSKLNPSHEAQPIDPLTRLKEFLIAISDFAFRFYQVSKISVSQEIQSGSIQTGMTLLPILREIYQQKKTETKLKIISLQLIAPIQLMFLNVDLYLSYTALDLFKKQIRDQFIDTVIENVIHDHD